MVRGRHKVVVWTVEETKQFYDVFYNILNFVILVFETIWNGFLYDEQGDHKSHSKGSMYFYFWLISS